MKKHLKVAVSILLLLCYLASPLSVLATVVETTMLDNGTKVVEISNIKTASYEMTGSLEVVMGLDLPISIEKEKVIKMTLLDEFNNQIVIDANLKAENPNKTLNLGTQSLQVRIEKTSQSRDEVLEGNEFYYLNIITEGLKRGKYNIKLEAEGFVPYEYKDIEISDYSKRLSISNKKGTFAIGDINDDKKINREDYDLLVSKIEENISDLEKYDLNCDGVIDVIDLSYIASNMEENTEVAPVVAELQNTNPIISSNNLNLSTSQNTTLIGNVQNLFDKMSNEVVGLQGTKAITEEEPVELNMEFEKPLETTKVSIELGAKDVPSKMEIVVEDENETIIRKSYDENEKEVSYLSDRNETVVIDLGGQVAVKKVTIRVTEVRTNSTLAEISRVEFLNNIYEEIPAPKMDIPERLSLTVGSEQITANWIHAVNVTGYKVKVNGGKINNKTYETTKNTFAISGLENYVEYDVQVESINGNWESGYSDVVKGMPIPTRKPPVPEQISVKGDYQRISASWKKMDDTQSYNIYYRKVGETNYTKISEITNNSYIIYDLEDKAEYEILISGSNHLGEGARSQIHKATTTALEAAITRNYKLINTPKEENGVKLENSLTSHIKEVTYPAASTTENFDKWDIVDNDYTSYWRHGSWDAGGYNAGKPSPIVEFDDVYKMDNLIVVPADTQPHQYHYVKIRYWNNTVQNRDVTGVSMQKKTSSNGKVYYDFKFKEPIEASKIQVNFANYLADGNYEGITIAEMKFYHYDDLEAQVAKLFKDDLRVELADGVTESKIKELEDRANTPDIYSGELHPNAQIILNDLEYARKILNDTAISDVVVVDQTINNGHNSHLGFSYTLNDLQPLGYVAKAGDEIAVYLGINGSANVQIVFTQYYPEYSKWKQNSINLKKGQNIVTVPTLTTSYVEKGGQIYIRYNSTQKTNTQIKVRVSGGQKIPILDIHGMTNEADIKDRIKVYAEELTTHVANLQKFYENKPYGYSYNKTTSILNSTDIVMDDVMLSIPATEALNGIGASASISDQINKLYNSNLAWKEMIGLFYKEKGISKEATNPKDKWPGSRLNIRYTRMFDGAFMYASGEHIGIGFGSSAGMLGGSPAKEVNGEIRTNYFGWGIAHEIGHVIDQSGYASAETTNNIYSLFAQTADDITPSRLEISNKYEKIYKKVTSHTEGLSGDVFTSLGMYWQLHLAYDNEKTLTGTNTFYSRLHTLYRADENKSILKNKYDKLICYASKAAGKDLTKFFEAWGIYVTDKEAVKTCMKDSNGNILEEETRPIYYLNDEARRYRLRGEQGIQGIKTLTASENLDNQNKIVQLTFEIDANSNDILGYEILRNGKSVRIYR